MKYIIFGKKQAQSLRFWMVAILEMSSVAVKVLGGLCLGSSAVFLIFSL